MIYVFDNSPLSVLFKNYYRGWDTSLADAADVARFPDLTLVGIEHFGGRDIVQPVVEEIERDVEEASATLGPPGFLACGMPSCRY